MKIISVNVGLPRKVEWKGKTVTTGIYKELLPGSVNVRTLNLEGDDQADLSVHGGRSKAVYVYPSEHYGFGAANYRTWPCRGEWSARTSPRLGSWKKRSGSGMNFASVRPGCKLLSRACRATSFWIRFGRPDMVKRFLQRQRSGFYFAVAQEGRVQAGDAIEYATRASHGVTVADVVRLYTTDRGNIDLLRRVVALEALGASWRGYFQHQLEKITV